MKTGVVDTVGTGNLTKIISGYLRNARTMQLATSSNNIPWVCSVYFVCDEKLKLYWLSYPNRRHSSDLSKNKRVAIAIAVNHDMPVVGVQAEGTAEKVTSLAVVAQILPAYVKKYGMGKQFLKNVKANKNKHCLYRFTPERIVLFDEENFGVDNPQILELPVNL